MPSASVNAPTAVAAYFSSFTTDPLAPTTIRVNAGIPTVRVGEFRAIGRLVLGEGWSGLENWGVWSDGNTAILYLQIDPLPDGDGILAEIVIDAVGAVSESHPHLEGTFEIDGSVGNFAFHWPGNTARIPIAYAPDREPAPLTRLVLRITNPKPAPPHDRRRLGIGLRSLELRPFAITTPSGSAAGVAEQESKTAAPALASNPKPRIRTIAMTMVYNEGHMLRRWISHYGRHLGLHNLLVIDHGSDDGSTDDLGSVGRINLPRSPFDDGQRAEFINNLQRNLFMYFGAVIYTDCDEFLVPDPRRFSSLQDYIGQLEADCVRPVGVNLLHIRDVEHPLRPDQGLLLQRSYCHFSTQESKPLIAKKPVVWQPGFHHCNEKALLDPSLILIHAKLADFDGALARLAITREMPWARRNGWGIHQRADDEAMIVMFENQEKYFRQDENVAIFCPEASANQTNTALEASGESLKCEMYTGPLCRLPAWLRESV
jgi:hypothetical protein